MGKKSGRTSDTKQELIEILSVAEERHQKGIDDENKQQKEKLDKTIRDMEKIELALPQLAKELYDELIIEAKKAAARRESSARVSLWLFEIESREPDFYQNFKITRSIMVNLGYKPPLVQKAVGTLPHYFPCLHNDTYKDPAIFDAFKKSVFETFKNEFQKLTTKEGINTDIYLSNGNMKIEINVFWDFGEMLNEGK